MLNTLHQEGHGTEWSSYRARACLRKSVTACTLSGCNALAFLNALLVPAIGLTATTNCTVWLCAAGMQVMHSHSGAALQRSTGQHSTAQHRAQQHSTAQHSTAQHSTAQHSTAQSKQTDIANTAQHGKEQHGAAKGHLRDDCKPGVNGHMPKALL